MKVAVTGAGGMIGGYLVKRMLEDGHTVLATDIKHKDEWLQWHDGAKNIHSIDLSTQKHAQMGIFYDTDEVYNLAATMGGIGYIEEEPMACVFSVDITSSMLKAAINARAGKFFQASSACAYPTHIQGETFSPALKESDAWRGRAEYGYGEEKLFGEVLCEIVDASTDTKTRVARYHNIYAPAYTTFRGGKEKAPAAICRKVAEAVISGSNEIEIWGDGEQQRSFCYIDDCIDGTIRLMRSEYNKPLNIGSDELVSINQLVSIVEDIAGVTLKRTYKLDAPQGVRGRNSDNALVREVLDWEPRTTLREGLTNTYRWIYDELK